MRRILERRQRGISLFVMPQILRNMEEYFKADGKTRFLGFFW